MVQNPAPWPTQAFGVGDAEIEGIKRTKQALDEIKALPGIATSNAAKNNRIYRVVEHELMYFNPDSGENVAKVAALIHEGK